MSTHGWICNLFLKWNGKEFVFFDIILKGIRDYFHYASEIILYVS